jgi:Mn2+/Fe2+ NRAMP family transporter
VRDLKWLTLALFSYVATTFILHVPWSEVALQTLRPSIPWNTGYLTALVAVLGTTISPYLLVWQASQEVEEVACNPDVQRVEADSCGYPRGHGSVEPGGILHHIDHCSEIA